MALTDEIFNYLPAGEWKDVEVVSIPSSMMRDRAVFLKARSVRRAGQLEFIKCFVKAGKDAGSSTKNLLNADRLKRLHERFQWLLKNDGCFPIAKVYDCLFYNEALVVSMEVVRPLSEIILANKGGIENAISLLSTLDPDRNILRDGWVHFDICPNNLGVDGNGNIVLIDHDSIYKIEERGFLVTTPACKDWRLPNNIYYGIIKDFQTQNNCLEPDQLKEKVYAEIALVAAELSLQSEPSIIGQFADEWVPRWLDDYTEVNAQLADVWRRVFNALFSRTELVPFSDIVGQLREVSQKSEVPSLERSGHPTGGVDWRRSIGDFSDYGLMLRHGHLDDDSLIEYIKYIKESLDREPNILELWRELVYIFICHLKDPCGCLEILENAKIYYPDDEDLKLKKRLVQVWLAGKTL